MPEKKPAAPLWTPTRASAAQSQLARYQAWLADGTGRRFADYPQLWRWSVDEPDEFWSSLWTYFGLGDGGTATDYESVRSGASMRETRWFTGATLNIADHLLAGDPAGDPDATAIKSFGEEGDPRTWTRGRLRREVAALARTLRDLGVDPGDRVVGYLPNIGEAVVAFLATAAVGAMWSSIGQDYGVEGTVERVSQLEPVVLVAADGYRYGGRAHDRRDQVAKVQEALPSLRATIGIAHLSPDEPLAGSLPWDRATSGSVPYTSVQVDFSHPLWVLFSSGTTGRPKGIVHSHGGVLLEQLKSLRLHWDLDEHDCFFWYTTPSWVMWNIQVCGLLCGGSIVTYDGSPTHPGADALWRVVERGRVSVFGSSPAYLRTCQNAGSRPSETFDLSALRALGTSGSPLAVSTHTWADAATGGLPLFSISGGTDIATAFCGGAPTVPVWAGELSVPCLGVAMESWDDEGRPQRNTVGELVVTEPMPSMPLFLWDDPDGHRYVESYYSTYAGVWRHGDWITVTDRGSVVVHGRSDSTLNRHGVRLGSGDIYGVVEQLPQVREALVVGVEQPDGGYWMPLFVVLADDETLTDELVGTLRAAIREQASPRHVPDEVIAVPALPHTRTGKKLEVPVKRLLQGADLGAVAQAGAVDDPALLEFFVGLRDERG